MTLLRIDLDKLVTAVAGAMPRRPDLSRAMQGIGAAGVQFWKKLAQSELTSTSRDYAAGIQVFYKDNKAFIELVGTLPNLVENGFPGGDMREWMLKSPKAKQGKKGPYLVIPFRHGTPGTGGRNVGRVMPEAIHEVAKQLQATLSRPASSTRAAKTLWGGRLNPNMPMKEAARAILTRHEKPWHATPIYMGMVRKEKKYEGATQSSYQTFRTISRSVTMGEDEDGNFRQNWFHPGVSPRRFAPRVQKHIEKIAMRLVAASLSSSDGT